VQSFIDILYGPDGYQVIFWMQVLLVFFSTILMGYFSHRWLVRLEKRLERTRPIWNDGLARAATKPFVGLIWVIGLTIAIRMVLNFYEIHHSAAAITTARDIGITAALTWFFFRAIHQVEKGYITRRRKERQPIDFPTVDVIGKAARVSVGVIAGLVLLDALGFSLSGLIAFGGVGGIVAGLSAKDTLANFFGAMMVYFGRPFVIGDWIRSPDRNIEGVVEKIGWRQTIIRTFDKRPLYVPNSLFSTIVVENATRMSHRRIREHVGIRYEDVGKAEAIVADISAMIRAVEKVDLDPANQPLVAVERFSPSAVDIHISCFLATTEYDRYMQAKQEILLKTAQIIASHGAALAVPTTTFNVQAPVAAPAPQTKKPLID
jgi:MscS family membrane protein